MKQLPRSLHFIGVGGAGMNPLADLCLSIGISVSGSDKGDIRNLSDFIDRGASLWSGHDASKLLLLENANKLPEACVISTAIEKTNPELEFFTERKIPVLHRSDLLKLISERFAKRIVISGTHGKTSTTSLLIWILEKAGLKVSWLVGGIINSLGASKLRTDGDIFVFEGDESDQSFLKTNPTHGLITSIEPDHLENYENSFDVQVSKFVEFAKKAENLFVNENLPYLQKIKTERETKIIEYGFKAQASIAEKINMPKLRGLHNISNALGAIGIAQELGVEPEKAVEYLSDFPGIYRRFELVFKDYDRNISVIDDYAHHPTEIKEAIRCAKALCSKDAEHEGGKLITLFQPHLPTRLRDLWEEFKTCFEGSDLLILSDLYLARGSHIEGINSKNLAAEMNHKNMIYCPGKPENMLSEALSSICPNDVILILGAGDITNIREQLAKEIVLRFQKREEASTCTR